MALELWPASLPQAFIASGYGEAAPEKNIITDDYNIGPPQYRRRTTSAPAPYMGQMFMTTVEWETLSSFFHATLFDGVLQFGFPPQGVADLSRFWISRFVSPPKRQMSNADDGWFVSLSLERIGIGEAILVPLVFTDPDIIYPARLVYNQTVSPQLYSSADVFYVPQMSAVELATAIYSNQNNIYPAEILMDSFVAVTFVEVDDS